MTRHSHNCAVAAKAVATAEGIYSLCLREAGRESEALTAERRAQECESLSHENE